MDGIPGEGEGETLLAELLFHMSHQGAALHLGGDAPLGIVPCQSGAHLQAEAAFRITPIVTDTTT